MIKENQLSLNHKKTVFILEQKRTEHVMRYHMSCVRNS